jgi:uncharacterized protein YxjI
MKTKNVIIAIGIIGVSIVAYVFLHNKPAKDQRLPNKFIVNEKVINKVISKVTRLVTSLNIEDDNNQDYGTISRDILNLTTTFSYTDANNKLVATGKKELFSWGTKIDFFDAKDNYIGAINENVMESMLKVYTNYTVLDKNEKKIATSEKTDILQTDITLTGTDGKEIAKLERDLTNITGDTWNIEIFQRDKIDARILPIIVAYKTYNDKK